MEPETILIVDDDEDLHTLYGLYLQSESYRILHAYHGAEALELVRRDRPGLIILDMIMPIMDGETFFTRLQEDESLKDIPVIIASVNEKIPRRILESPSLSAALKKPFTIETLIGKVRAVFASR